MLATSLGQDEELHWLALRLVPGLGARNAGKLIERFRTPQAVLRASRTELEAAGELGIRVLQLIAYPELDAAIAAGVRSGQGSDRRRVGPVKIFSDGSLTPEALVALAQERGVAVLAITDHDSVEALPYARAVAGSGVELVPGIEMSTAAERLSGDLARAGLVIVSGMARGIDTAAHRSALAAGGETIAVLGCGVDIVYPSENRKLAGEIAAKGLLLSEFPMGTVAFPQNFPIRNRVISGMSVGILVVEGAQYSGSSITAKLALDQGRELFAVPGNITSKTLVVEEGGVFHGQSIMDGAPAQAEQRPQQHGQPTYS